MRTLLRRLREVVDIVDLHLYGGALLIASGVATWRPGAGLIVFGLILLLIGLGLPGWTVRRYRPRDGRD
ncbi:MAG: hypothetical protein GEU90_00625 [Gemmatimonas sp.]|nr:hypothetical protein [Gemmatimonas sp.]